MKKLENPQECIYEFHCRYYNKYGYPPTVREICEAVGLSSPATVHTHLKTMESKGLIHKDPNKQRTFTIPALQRTVEPQIPLLGSVAAGIPIMAEENIEDSYALPQLLMSGTDIENAFMLHVHGDSMINAGIHDQDIIVVSQGQPINEGDIVVARVDSDKVTVKRFFCDEHNSIRLMPENPNYEPICLSSDRVEIVGKVTGLMRRF